MAKYMERNSLGILIESKDPSINSDTVEIRLSSAEYQNLLTQEHLNSTLMHRILKYILQQMMLMKFQVS